MAEPHGMAKSFTSTGGKHSGSSNTVRALRAA
jgi:hypothetical protein